MTFTFTEQELQIIGNALIEQPYKLVVGVLASIQAQINATQEPVKPVEQTETPSE